MHSRMLELRKVLKLSQEEFGTRIGVKGNSVSRMESGERPVVDRTIKSICSTFNVSYDWLVHGTPPMFKERDARTLALLDDLVMGDNKTAKALLQALARFTDDEWALLDKMMEEVNRWKED